MSATVTEKSTTLAKDLLNTELIYVSSEKRAAPATGQIKQSKVVIISIFFQFYIFGLYSYG